MSCQRTLVIGNSHRSFVHCAGKSVATFAALRYLSSRHAKRVIYIVPPEAGVNPLTTVCYLFNGFLFTVSLAVALQLHLRYELQKCVKDLLNTIGADAIVLDGNHPMLEGYAGALKLLYRKEVEFFVAINAVYSPVSVFGIKAPRPYTAQPWGLDDYLSAAEVMHFTPDQLCNLECPVEASVACVQAVLRRKFLIAGHSCKFMLAYPTPCVIALLTRACSESHEWSRLLVDWIGHIIPVSLGAAALIGQYGLHPAPTQPKLIAMVATVQKRRRAILTWLFKEDVVDCITARAAASPDSEGSPTGATHQTLRLCRCDGSAYPFPEAHTLHHYGDWREIVEEIARLASTGFVGAVVFLSADSVDPFFDFAMAQIEE